MPIVLYKLQVHVLHVNYLIDCDFSIACSMSDVDKRLFPADSRTFEWHKFLYAYYAGMRVYVLMDPLETFPQSKAKLRKLKYIHFTLKYSFLIILVLIIYAFVLKRLFALYL